ncbi:acetyltransferase [Colletotrichum karsti]|uniref:Acetyltransferase n=1 Tax=Colletotrichum karsti TaxID=1095194 RepID=A0A9P6LIL4_9PEZI|nr:acetyltransferase [Colletotrichum karsti]KAF9877439.1 acetyltransferase [Colletotrichum karsti]
MTVSKPQPPPLTFRTATPSDIPVLLPLIRSAYRGEFSRKGWTTEADLVADQRIDEAGLLAKITEPDGVVFLVTEDTGSTATTTPASPTKTATPTKTTAPPALSCCELLRRADGAVAYFGLFAVDPERQAGGVGRRVLEHAERFAVREWGVRRIEMCVIWSRAELIAWYERRGYVRTGETRAFPYEQLVGGEALRDDLYFVVLEKELSV